MGGGGGHKMGKRKLDRRGVNRIKPAKGTREFGSA